MRIVRSVAARPGAVARVPALKPLGAILVILSVWFGLAVGPAAAQVTLLVGTSSATYDTLGRSFTNADGFILSGNDAGPTYRAVLAFTVPAGSPNISQAVFSLPASNNTSGDPVTELRSVSTPLGYAAIGDGALIASAVTVPRNLGVNFVLNASGLAAVNALAGSGGGVFYVGLKLSDEGVAGTSRYYSIAGPSAYSLNLTRTPSVTVSPNTLPAATVGQAYSQTLTAFGGTAPYTYIVSSGSLPAGLSLSPGGVLSGAPTAGGLSNLTITATDSSTDGGPFAGAQSYSLQVNPGVPAAVPTMSEWAMILFGMLLAGIAALYVQRRRTAA